ncbi:MAG: hypothetical protein ACOC12_04555 [Bacteroidota bacterium]
MEYIIKDQERIYETLVQNVHKGEIFLVKLKDEPVAVRAIPYINHNLPGKQEMLVTLKIIEPEISEDKSVYQKPLKSIEFIQMNTE